MEFSGDEGGFHLWLHRVPDAGLADVERALIVAAP